MTYNVVLPCAWTNYYSIPKETLFADVTIVNDSDLKEISEKDEKLFSNPRSSVGTIRAAGVRLRPGSCEDCS